MGTDIPWVTIDRLSSIFAEALTVVELAKFSLIAKHLVYQIEALQLGKPFRASCQG